MVVDTKLEGIGSERDKKVADINTIQNVTNKLSNTGGESSLPLLGSLSIVIGFSLSVRKNIKN